MLFLNGLINRDEARERLRDIGVLLTPTITKVVEVCPSCNQTDTGQTGEYPCPMCGLPTLHDEKTV
jgi:rubrerythrin